MSDSRGLLQAALIGVLLALAVAVPGGAQQATYNADQGNFVVSILVPRTDTALTTRGQMRIGSTGDGMFWFDSAERRAAFGDASNNALAGDTATGFFSAGQIERARGGTNADTSAYGAGLFGSDAGNLTIDVDTEAELETAIGGLDFLSTTTSDWTSAQLLGAISDETGTGILVFATDPALAGNPTAPTAAADDNDTSIASTAFVQQEHAESAGSCTNQVVTAVNADAGPTCATVDMSAMTNLTGGRSTTMNADALDADIETYEHTKCMVIETPADADNFLFYRVDRAATVTGIDCLSNAATSTVITVQECNSNGASCTATEAAITCGTTNSTEATSIDDAVWDATDWIRIDVGTVTGTPGHVAVCVTFTNDD